MKLLIILIVISSFTKAPATQETETPTLNICDFEENDEQIYCYCSGPPKEAVLECQVTGDSLTQTNEYWKHFLHQPHVKTFRIIVKSYGNLTFFPQQALTELKGLGKFDIAYATIDDIPSHTFANMSALTQLKLKKNHIAAMASRAFVHLPNLTEINLDDNNIHELQRDVFVDVPALQQLFAINNNMSIIHDRAFEHLHSLVELELAANLITVLTKDTFMGLKNLNKLDLNRNRIGMLGDDTFQYLVMLEELLLDSNKIQLISEKAFNGLPNLKLLKLRDNKISTLPSMVFEGLTNLYFLDLNTNFLVTINYDTIKPVMHNLLNKTSYFLVNENQFTCDCRLAWTHQLHNQTANVLMREQLDNMLCLLPEEQDEDTTEALEVSATSVKSLDNSQVVNQDDAPMDVEYEYYDEFSESSSTRRFLHIPLSELPCTPEALATEEMQQIMHVPTETNVGIHSIAMHWQSLTLIAIIVCAYQ